MPESQTPLGVERGSYEHAMFVTMVVSIDYMRNADQLWNAGRATYNDEATRWVFDPSELVNKSDEEIVRALKVHRLSKKPRKDALEIWLPVAKTLHDLFDSDPFKLIERCNYNAMTLYRRMKTRYKRRFPYLSGNKILPLWIRMLNDDVGVDLKNIEQIPLPVDVHTARATFCLGCLTGRYTGSISQIWSRIDDVWRKACQDSNYYRLQFDEPLWHLSRYGCTHRTDRGCRMRLKCPAGQYCVSGEVFVSQDRGVKINTTLGDPQRTLT